MGKKAIWLVAVWLVCGLLFTVRGEAAQKWTDLPYATASAKQKLDIYLPEIGEAPYPVIIAFHGRGGDKLSVEMNGPLSGLQRGYAVVCVNYREPPEARFPADVMDAKTAVRFVRANADKYKLDSSRIAAWGDSMGGRLVSFLGTTAAHPEFDDFSFGYVGESCRVNAVVAWFPALDDVNIDADFRKLGLKPALSRNDADYGLEMYGAPVQKIAGLVGFSNPIRYVDSSAVPFCIEHGTSDGVCPISQSEMLAEKLRHNIGGGRVTFIAVDGAGHHTGDFTNEENLREVFKFLHEHLHLDLKNNKKKNRKA